MTKWHPVKTQHIVHVELDWLQTTSCSGRLINHITMVVLVPTGTNQQWQMVQGSLKCQGKTILVLVTLTDLF